MHLQQQCNHHNFRFNIDTKYGRVALEATFKAIMGYEQPIVKPPEEYNGDVFKVKTLKQLLSYVMSNNSTPP